MNPVWHQLRQLTQARIGLGHCGSALPTTALIDFQIAHAQARDSILTEWKIPSMVQELDLLKIPYVQLESQAPTRAEYIKRPDLGRLLDEKSKAFLKEQLFPKDGISLLISNGLSSNAVNQHGLPLLRAILDALVVLERPLLPIMLIPNARVALSDQIGLITQSQLSIMIIGERPGLSAADSLGIYLTHTPYPGKSDADRNCLSNIRPPQGLGYIDAAIKIHYLSKQALQLGYSGVNLKDDMPSQQTALHTTLETPHI